MKLTPTMLASMPSAKKMPRVEEAAEKKAAETGERIASALENQGEVLQSSSQAQVAVVEQLGLRLQMQQAEMNESLRKIHEGLAKSQSYEFTMKRDANGALASVVARPMKAD
jgi:hypothetical protein